MCSVSASIAAASSSSPWISSSTAASCFACWRFDRPSSAAGAAGAACSTLSASASSRSLLRRSRGLSICHVSAEYQLWRKPREPGINNRVVSRYSDSQHHALRAAVSPLRDSIYIESQVLMRWPCSSKSSIKLSKKLINSNQPIAKVLLARDMGIAPTSRRV